MERREFRFLVLMFSLTLVIIIKNSPHVHAFKCHISKEKLIASCVNGDYLRKFII